MIEQILRDYLTAALGVGVYLEFPKETPPGGFVVLEKTGSGMRDHIFSATFAVQSYGNRLYDAAVLNEEVKGALLYGGVPKEICRVSLNSDYNFTDPESKRYRYQAVYDITHY